MDLFIKSRKNMEVHAMCSTVTECWETLTGQPWTKVIHKLIEGFLHCFPPSSLHSISQIICIPSSITDNNNKYSFFVKTFWVSKDLPLLILVFAKVWYLRFIISLFYWDQMLTSAAFTLAHHSVLSDSLCDPMTIAHGSSVHEIRKNTSGLP